MVCGRCDRTGFVLLRTVVNFYYRIEEKTILPLMLLAGGGMNHLMVLVSRYIFMPNDKYGMSSRYALQYQIGIIGIFLTFALAAKCGFCRKKATLAMACKDCIYRSRSHVPHWKRDDDD